MSETLIELRDITKSYGRVYALGGVNLSVRKGEVVGLIGDNGAGKSTLIKILSGVVKPTTGEILVRGKPVHGWSAAKSREAGIETVFQDRALAVQQSIVRNIFMGRELAGPFGWLKVGQEIREAERLMREIATICRWPPDSRRTGTRMLVKFLLSRPKTLRAWPSMKWSSSVFQAVSFSRPRKRLATESRLSASASVW